MADPFTLSMAATAGGSILEGIGGSSAASSKAASYRYQAGISRINSEIATKNAALARDQGEAEALRYGMKSAVQKGQIVASQAASGFDVGSGSAVDVQKGQELVGRIDQNQIRANAAQKAYSFETEAWKYGLEAENAEIAARNAKKEGKLALLKSLVGGAASVSSKWSQASSLGIGSSPSYGGWQGDSGYYGWIDRPA